VQRWDIKAQKISIIENGVETDLFHPDKPVTDLRTRLDVQGRFVVCYVGTMGMAHGLDTILESAQILQTIAPHVLILLVGEGADKERIKTQAAARGLQNVRFLDRQPREEIPELICASDACLVPLKKTELFKTVIPTKLLEFMACGRPVILGVEGQARKIVENAQAGLAIEPQNPAALVQSILWLSSRPELCRILGRNGRRHILENFSRQQKAAEYLIILEDLVGTRSARKAAAA
jgi:glycosyltransferase involved in cell wall biosynthesis